MTALLQLNRVEHEKFGQLSFSLHENEIRVLNLANKDAKPLVTDMILGELLPEKGNILLQGKPPAETEFGQAGIIQANGGMISNLKVWENVTLPKWYHGSRQRQKMEEMVAHWLRLLHPDQSDWERFMGSPVGKLRNSERKMAGIMRMLVTSPRILLIDAALFDDVDDVKCARWISVLEQFIKENSGHALLAVCHQANRLPWPRIELSAA